MVCVAKGDIGRNLGRAMDALGMRPVDLIIAGRRKGAELSAQRVSNWLRGDNDPHKDLLPLLADITRTRIDFLVGPPDAPVAPPLPKDAVRQASPMDEIRVPKIQPISAGSTWTDPLDSDDTEPIPPFMYSPLTFVCEVDGDSMYDFLHPGDVAVFERDPTPRLGLVVIARNDKGGLMIKQLKHSGVDYLLHPLNPKYSDVMATNWKIEGFLTGFIRFIGGDTIIRHNVKGLRP